MCTGRSTLITLLLMGPMVIRLRKTPDFVALVKWGGLCRRIISNEAVCGNAFFKEHVWFKPWILRRLVDYAGLTQKQIFDCLTGDVRSHEQLKNRLIFRYGNREKIAAAFAFYGF